MEGVCLLYQSEVYFFVFACWAEMTFVSVVRLFDFSIV